MLQELRATVSRAAALVGEIGVRFQAGDAADELLAELNHALDFITRQPAADIPADVQAEIGQLLLRVQETVAVGERWLEHSGPELATLQQRQRLNRTYGNT